MRILLAVPSLRCGGAERVISILANHWAAGGHEVALATFEPPESDFFELDSRIRRFVVGQSGPLGPAWIRDNRRRLGALRRTVRQTQPEVVLSFLYTMNLLAIAAAKGLAPVVVAERIDARFHRIERWQAALRRLLYPMAAAVVVQTRGVLEEWVPRVAPRVHAYAIPNPVLAPAPAAWDGPAVPGRVVAAAGRLERRKGFDLLIDAFARTAADFPEWSLVIFGEGEERDALAAQAASRGLADRVLLLGNGETSALFAKADIFVAPSRLEGFPNALLEAMAAGLPVVATDCHSGPGEIVRDGVDGYLVPVDDEEDLANALRRLLCDPELRESFGARAQEVVGRFGIDGVAAQWERVFTDVRSTGT